MAAPPDSPNPGGDRNVRRDRGSTTGTPRWVKVFGVIAAIVVVLLVVLLLTGRHGPGRHGGMGGGAESVAPANATADRLAGADSGGHSPPTRGRE